MRKTLLATHPEAQISVLQLDLASLESVKTCAAEFLKSNSRLDYLFLNAGVSALAPALTKEGYEVQFGINHVGHALLTQLLMPTILSTKRSKADARILVTSSIAAINNTAKGLDLSDAGTKTANAYDGTMVRYGASKLANVLFARSLAAKYPEITTTSHHPGVVWTSIWGKASGFNSALLWLVKPAVRLLGTTADQGAELALWTAFAAVGSGKGEVGNGSYYEGVGKARTQPERLVDDAHAERLWKWTSEELAKHGAPGWPEEKK